MPNHIYTSKCITLSEAMRTCATPHQTALKLGDICQSLAKLLQLHHEREIVLCDVVARNVVEVEIGNRRVWTLLEFCNASCMGFTSERRPARSTSPEVRFQLLLAFIAQARSDDGALAHACVS